jgi:hypothetical protein
MIGSSLDADADADDEDIGLFQISDMVMNWTKLIRFAIPESFRRHILLIRPTLSIHDFLSHRHYMSLIERHVLRTKWDAIPLRLVADADALLLYNAAAPFYELQAMHTPLILSHFNRINETINEIMNLE